MRSKPIYLTSYVFAISLFILMTAHIKARGQSPSATAVATTAVGTPPAGTLSPYQVAPDFSNITMTAKLSLNQMALLQKNAFVVVPGGATDFSTVYQAAWQNHQPLFITTDSMLYSFHLVFDKVLRTSESQYFLPAVKKLNQAMLVQADKQYQALKGTTWENAAKQTVAFLGVGVKLADPGATIPDYVSSSVDQEVKHIADASGIDASAVFPDLTNGEDWSQYKPRGHYTLSADLTTYFRILMYYGRMVFRASDKNETQAAILLTLALRDTMIDSRKGIDVWNSIYQPTSFFVGISNKPTIQDYMTIFEKVYGIAADLKTVQTMGVDSFTAEVSKLPVPRILSAIIYDNQDMAQQTAGLSFMGQRFTWDAYVFNQLVYKNVGTPDKPRLLPMALDIFAALGSDRALHILDQKGETAYQNYTTQMKTLREKISQLDETTWNGSLYNGWLYTTNTLNEPIPSGYPSFMLNPAYQDRNLYASLGSFSELKRDNILYTMQSITTGIVAAPPTPTPPPPQPVYVEPLPIFWSRLAFLAETAQSQLDKQKLLDPADRQTLKQIIDLSHRFGEVSLDEIQGKTLNTSDLDSYGNIMEMMASVTGSDQGFTTGSNVATVADIATDPNSGKVLELGVGNVSDIFVIVPINGTLTLAHGGIFSVYEFTQPLNNRLTDETWRSLLEKNAPALPDWTADFVATP